MRWRRKTSRPDASVPSSTFFRPPRPPVISARQPWTWLQPPIPVSAPLIDVARHGVVVRPFSYHAFLLRFCFFCFFCPTWPLIDFAIDVLGNEGGL